MEKKIKEKMEDTCYRSISYCCGLDKDCSVRDKAIKNLGITKKDFKDLKKQFDKNLINLLKNSSPN